MTRTFRKRRCSRQWTPTLRTDTDLRGSSGPIALTPKALDLLGHLTSRAGRLVTKRELLDNLWPDVFVTNAGLSCSSVKPRVLAAVAGGLVVIGCAAPQRSPRPRPVIRLMSGPTGGGFYPLGEGLVTAFGRLMPDVTVEHHASTGAVNNAELIQSGNADVGFVFADVAYVAYVGRLERKQVFDRLRGLAVLELTPLNLVVRPDIKSVRELRGRRVAVGPPGSGTALTAELVLRAFDIKLSDIHTEALQFDDAARRLMAGHLDAMFDTAIYPAEAVRMAAAAGARLMPITGSPIDKLRLQYPFFRAAVIPRDAYPGVTEAVHTIGVDSLLVCRRDLDEELVYQLTRRFFDALPMLSSSRNALRLMDLDQAPATPIPLHDGAARYYRERELLR